MNSQADGQAPTEQKRHSRLGIAAFIISLMATLLFMGCYLYWLYCTSIHDGYVDSLGKINIPTSDRTLILYGSLLSALLFIFSTALGIGGLLQQGKNKVLSVISTCFSVLALPVVLAVFYFCFI